MPDTLIQLLQARLGDSSSGGFKYLHNGEVADQCTYGELDRSARAIAARLQAEGVGAAAPVLLLYAPGLEFVRALFGCFYAGATAVPVYPPNPARLARTLPRLRAIARDIAAKTLLTSSDIAVMRDAMNPLAPELWEAKWIATDSNTADPEAWKAPAVRGSDLAIVQYTSGSTREPRGVMLTHANVLHNQEAIREGFNHKPGPHNVVLSWLPVYHDMGLIGMTLHPIYLGGTAVHMSPMEFLQNPYRWLAATSQFRATASGAPNFAYELCNRKVTDEQIGGLDLSSWRVAYCGAEPVRKDTLERFASRLAPTGFKRSALLPCYGLAEATLIVAGTSRPEGVVACDVNDAELRAGRVVADTGSRSTSIVGCGRAVGELDVAIVTDGKRCKPRELGEIWLRGGSVARGYWKNAEDTAATFGATLEDGSGPFLRTGDLGFLDATGELFIVGRAKDVIIVRGLNYYPHDLELAAESAWPGLRPGCVAAFALEGEEKDEVVIVCEHSTKTAKEGVGWDVIVDAVRNAIAVEFELAVRAIAIVSPGQVAKTPSGKVQRSEMRRRYLAGELEILHLAKTRAADNVVIDGIAIPTAENITRFITSWLSELLGRPVDPDAEFATLGLDSIEAVRLIDALAENLGYEIDPMLAALDYPSASLLGNHLASRSAPGG
jgi:acyl-CoA synthetase (AMP-forming)/AMP-acid ligase II/acyl carrier protein